MNVIRHEAVSVQGESVLRKGFFERSHGEIDGQLRRKCAMAAASDESQEVGVWTGVIEVLEAR
jgi:hypothetical protein